jgi:hypothetical protein
MSYGPAIIEHRKEHVVGETRQQDRWINWAMLHTGDGEGWAVSEEHKDGVASPAEVRYWRFRLCVHDWRTKSANPRRGYWEGRCRKCGQERVRDSGD